jgi:hypothetical protein
VSASPLSGSGRFRPDPDVASGRAARRGRGCVQKPVTAAMRSPSRRTKSVPFATASPFSGPKLQEKRANSP